MYDDGARVTGDGPALDAAAVRAMVQAVATIDGPVGVGVEVDAERVALLEALEDLKNAAAGLQVVVTAAFDASQCRQQVDAGESARRVGRGVAAQVGLARRCSPHQGARHLSLARVASAELPRSLAALRAGAISERALSLVAQGTTCLSRAHRGAVDEQICGDLSRARRLGERGVAAEVAKAAARLDPASVVERRRRAEAERRVTLRPAPDTMTYLTALMPVADGVAVYAALTRAADSARSAGDERTRGQVMADGLRDAVLRTAAAGPRIDTGAIGGDGATERGESAEARAAGRSESADERSQSDGRAGRGAETAIENEPPLRGAPAGVGIVLNVVMSEKQLFGAGEASEGEVLLGDPAGGLLGVDADLVRQLAALTPAERIWVRRLYTHPDSGELVAMDSRQRRFPKGLQRLIRFRDQYCRNPWCRAPIRHGDHALPHARDGPTSRGNGQGLCEACNYAKQAWGWRTRPLEESAAVGRHGVETTTPTGQIYVTYPPEPPGEAASRRLWTIRTLPTIEIAQDRPRDAA